jgi:hypothetical protein
MRKGTEDAVNNLLASAQSTAEAVKALTGLAEAARHAATFGIELQTMAATVERLIDILAPRVVYALLFKA